VKRGINTPYRILYILGAGASANALPMVNAQRDQNGTVIMNSLIDELIIFTSQVAAITGLMKFHSLCLSAANFSSPDTFAKFLYVNGQNFDYRDFKTLLAAYFFFKERIEKNAKPCVDKRMLSFLTTIMQDDSRFPKNVKILSWNYDNQFFIASNWFDSQDKNKVLLRMFRSFPFTQDNTIDKAELNFVHLNGVAGFYFDSKLNKYVYAAQSGEKPMVEILSEFDGMTPEKQIERILNIFSAVENDQLISFAWEKAGTSMACDPFVKGRIEHARALARATDILVVIGYSFPFFNRQIDEEIFSEMPTLTKIYFQDPVLDGSFLKSQFSLDERIQILPVKNTNNYYVPYEL
jgi:hypothetical protein